MLESPGVKLEIVVGGEKSCCCCWFDSQGHERALNHHLSPGLARPFAILQYLPKFIHHISSQVKTNFVRSKKRKKIPEFVIIFMVEGPGLTMENCVPGASRGKRKQEKS